MKVETQSKPFRPVMITLESREELVAMRFLMLAADDDDIKQTVARAAGTPVIAPSFAVDVKDRLARGISSQNLDQS
jgi:hypothetical protein